MKRTRNRTGAPVKRGPVTQTGADYPAFAKGRDISPLSFVLLALIGFYCLLAVASGLDRAAENNDRARYVPYWPYAAFHALVQTRIAFLRHDYPQMQTRAALAVRLSPLDTHVVGSLGLADEMQGDTASAERAFTLSRRLGWRDTPTQLYWFDKAVALGDMTTASRHLGAMLSVAPQMALADQLIGRMSQFEQGRDALAVELRKRPKWLIAFVTQFDHPTILRLDARADVVLRAGHGLWTCDQLSVLVDRLRSEGLLEDARAVWQANCSSPSALIYDPDFIHADRDSPTTGYNWTIRREGGVIVDLTSLPDGGHILNAQVEAASTSVFALQPTALSAGTYRISWAMPNTAAADRDAVSVTLDCDQDLSDAAKGQPAPGSPGRYFADLAVTEDCPAPYLAFWLVPHHTASLAHVAMTRQPD